MKKSVLLGVSISAILSATGANAAGYTCEELIEYTSCSAGYYSGCPDGSVYGTGWCVMDLTYAEEGWDEEECLFNGFDYLGTGCLTADGMEFLDLEDVWRLDGNASLVPQTCTECPVGSICAGGDVDIAVATLCPAGSYCATAGASVATGKCNVGTYSTGGATAATCTPCPETSLIDKDGDPVSATTSSTGSTSASACHIGDDVEFQDNKGIWHYKNSCAFFELTWRTKVTSEQECEKIAVATELDWEWDDECYYAPQEQAEFEYLRSILTMQQTESECSELRSLYADFSMYEFPPRWEDGRCVIDENTCREFRINEHGLYCTDII